MTSVGRSRARKELAQSYPEVLKRATIAAPVSLVERGSGTNDGNSASATRIEPALRGRRVQPFKGADGDVMPDEWGTAALHSAKCDQSVARRSQGTWQRNVTRRVPAVSGETEQKVDISSTRRTALTSASLTWGTP
jgi:hypothetical protein